MTTLHAIAVITAETLAAAAAVLLLAALIQRLLLTVPVWHWMWAMDLPPMWRGVATWFGALGIIVVGSAGCLAWTWRRKP